MPASSRSILEEERERGRLCVGTERLWTLVRALLARSSPGDLRGAPGMGEGMENLFLKHYARAESFEDFVGRCVCPRYTRGRLQRALARLLVGTGKERLPPSPPYARVLGFNERGRELLRSRPRGGLPLVTRFAGRAAGAKNRNGADACAEAELRASRLWELLVPASNLQRESRAVPARI
jgi:predicted nucleotidyltransferase